MLELPECWVEYTKWVGINPHGGISALLFLNNLFEAYTIFSETGIGIKISPQHAKYWL